MEINKQIAVVKVIDDLTLVLNVGSDQGVSKGDAFLVYYVDPDEILDPATGESLGKLEIVRGSGSVIHVQEKICTIKSNRTESRGKIVRANRGKGLAAMMAFGEVIEEEPAQSIPFVAPREGDFAKPI